MRNGSINLRTISGIGTGMALLVVPVRLRWSRRSRRLLRLSAAGLIGVPWLRRRREWGDGLERASVALIGLMLCSAQYLLSEEDSSVRGAIATIGGLLLASALIAPHEPMNEERDARS